MEITLTSVRLDRDVGRDMIVNINTERFSIFHPGHEGIEIKCRNVASAETLTWCSQQNKSVGCRLFCGSWGGGRKIGSGNLSIIFKLIVNIFLDLFTFSIVYIKQYIGIN